MKYSEIAELALKEGKVDDLTPQYVEFKETGQQFCGKFLNRSPVESKNSDIPYFQYLFEGDVGLVKFHLGRATDNEAGIMFEPGKIYVIQFLGKEPIAGGRSVNKFKIHKVKTDDQP